MNDEREGRGDAVTRGSQTTDATVVEGKGERDLPSPAGENSAADPPQPVATLTIDNEDPHRTITFSLVGCKTLGSLERRMRDAWYSLDFRCCDQWRLTHLWIIIPYDLDEDEASDTLFLDMGLDREISLGLYATWEHERLQVMRRRKACYENEVLEVRIVARLDNN